VYRKAPVDEEFAVRLLAAAASVRSRRDPKAAGHVYVVLLQPDPRGGPFRIYVGSTGIGPTKRFEQHKNDIKAGKGWVRDHGLGLLPKVYARFNPMLGRHKEDVEDELGRAFKDAGFDVHGPHRKNSG
jgi:hypothetical protein